MMMVIIKRGRERHTQPGPAMQQQLSRIAMEQIEEDDGFLLKMTMIAIMMMMMMVVVVVVRRIHSYAQPGPVL